MWKKTWFTKVLFVGISDVTSTWKILTLCLNTEHVATAWLSSCTPGYLFLRNRFMFIQIFVCTSLFITSLLVMMQPRNSLHIAQGVSGEAIAVYPYPETSGSNQEEWKIDTYKNLEEFLGSYCLLSDSISVRC